ncbi:hypothetical protein ACWIUD_10400 [Helicobacter sp. 23-1044]
MGGGELARIYNNSRLFYAFGFLYAYGFGLNLILFPLTNEYFEYIALAFGIFLFFLVKDFGKLNKIYKQISEIVGSLDDKYLYFTLQDIYSACEIKDKRLKFKGFIDEVIQGIEYSGSISGIMLYDRNFYFKPKDLQNIISAMESLIKETLKVAYKEAISQAKDIIDLPAEYLEDFLKSSGNVNKYIFDNGAYFIHNVNLDNFVFCESCGKAEDKNATNDIDGEWFCSNLCEDTENRCLEISEDLNPVILDGESYESYKERFTKNLSNTTSTAATTLGVAEVWTKNFKAIQGSEDYLKYIKGYTESTTSYTDANGRFVKIGDFVDSSGNKVNLNATGHGFSAEIMNHENDTNAFERFFRVNKNEIVGDDNAKHGADRTVGDTKIQTKYCKTANRSVNAACDDNGNYVYIDKDTGKPMQLEVPKDQYEQAVKIMEEKIKQGQVPGVTDPNEAKNLVKGGVPYKEAKAYCKFCSKESLKFDAQNGAVIAVVSFGVSFVINTSLCYYRERDLKKALKESFIIGIKTGGKAFAVYMVGAQIQRIPAINHFLEQVINFNFNGNAVGRALAEVGKKGASKAGEKAVHSAANSALRGTIVVAAATMAVTSSVEVVRMMRGQISGMQCVKNIVVNAGGIAGGAAGALAGAAALSFIPGAGTIIGGLAGGIVGGMGGGAVAKKLMDKFIEDDLTKKRRIFFEHIIALSVLFKLSKDEGAEFSAIVNKILQNDNDFFGKKFEIKAMLPYANSVLKPIVVAIVSQRPKLPNFDKDMVIDAVVEEIQEAS